MNINVARNGQQIGSFPLEEINSRLASGALLPGDLGWQEGMGEWKPLHSLQGVRVPSGAALAPAAPPAGGLAPSTGSARQQYLASIRATTAYPTFRAVIGVVAILGYIIAGLYALVALVAGGIAMGREPASGIGLMLGGFVGAAIVFVMARFGKEAATILADIADSITDANSRR